MDSTKINILYRGKECAVIVAEGEMPSLLLPQTFASHLASLLSKAELSARGLQGNLKAAPILELCDSLQLVLARLGRESIEWEAQQPMPQDQKDATIELRDAIRELDRIQDNDGPNHA